MEDVVGVFQWADIDLGAILSTVRRGLTESEARGLLRPLLHSLCAIHEAGWRHNDIKPGNILCTLRGEVMLCDFGQACRAEDCKPAGTRWYRSPAALAGTADAAADSWALGACMVELLSGAPPALGSSDLQQLCLTGAVAGVPEQKAVGLPVHIPSGPAMPGCMLLPGSSKLAVEFARAALTWDSDTRASPNQLLAMPWLATSNAEHDHAAAALLITTALGEPGLT